MQETRKMYLTLSQLAGTARRIRQRRGHTLQATAEVVAQYRGGSPVSLQAMGKAFAGHSGYAACLLDYLKAHAYAFEPDLRYGVDVPVESQLPV